MKLTLLDTETGQTKRFDDSASPYWWAEGNGSCDCNREIRMLGKSTMDNGTCLGHKRFLIIECSDPTYSIRELNEGYKGALLMEHQVV